MPKSKSKNQINILSGEIKKAGGVENFVNGLSGSLASFTSTYRDLIESGFNGALQYGGLRDVFKSAGWKPAGTNMETLADMCPFYYRRVGTARTIIDKPPSWTWRRGFSAVSDENDNFSSEVNDLLNETGILSAMWRADKLSRVGQYGILVLGYDDIENLQELQEPVAAGAQIIEAKPYMQESVSSIQEDFRDPGTYTYTINIDNKTNGSNTGTTIRVHSSRLIHIADNQDESARFGTPALVPVMNEIDDLEKIAGASGEGFWRYRGTYVLQQIMDKEGRPIGFKTDTEQDDLLDAFNNYMYGLYHSMILKNVTPTQIADKPQSPKEWQAATYERIAVGIDWPVRILRGSETGERASEQDNRQFAGMIEARQTNHAEPDIVRPVIDALIASKQLSTVKKYDIIWPSVLVQTNEEIMATVKDMAEINSKMSITGAEVFSIEEMRMAANFPAEIDEGV